MTYDEVLPVVRELAKEYNIKGNPEKLREFMEKAFDRATVKYNLCKDFQRRVKVYGDVFETVFMVIIEELFGETLETRYYFNPRLRNRNSMFDGSGESEFCCC
jgi:hypothetical protein